MPSSPSSKRAPKVDPSVQIADALHECAKGLKSIAFALERLGANGASGPHGAIEFLAVEIRDGIKDAGESIASALQNKD